MGTFSIVLIKYGDALDDVADAGRTVNALDDVADAGRTVNALDDVADAGRTVNALDDVADAGRTVNALDNVADAGSAANKVDDIGDAAKAADDFDDAADAGKTADDMGDAADASKAVDDIDDVADAGSTVDSLNELTNPSGTPNDQATPRGNETRIRPSDDQATTRSLTRENETAKSFAENGYDIEQNPVVEGTNRKPDYRIENELFDCYAPNDKTSVRNIASTIEEKIIVKQQAERVVLNLDDWNGDINDIIKQLNDYPIEGLKEVLINKNNQIFRIYP